MIDQIIAKSVLLFSLVLFVVCVRPVVAQQEDQNSLCIITGIIGEEISLKDTELLEGGWISTLKPIKQDVLDKWGKHPEFRHSSVVHLKCSGAGSLTLAYVNWNEKDGKFTVTNYDLKVTRVSDRYMFFYKIGKQRYWWVGADVGDENTQVTLFTPNVEMLKDSGDTVSRIISNPDSTNRLLLVEQKGLSEMVKSGRIDIKSCFEETLIDNFSRVVPKKSAE